MVLRNKVVMGLSGSVELSETGFFSGLFRNVITYYYATFQRQSEKKNVGCQLIALFSQIFYKQRPCYIYIKGWLCYGEMFNK